MKTRCFLQLTICCLVSVAMVSPAAISVLASDDADSPKTADSPSELSDYQLMTLFVDAFQQIETNYVRDIDRRVLVEAAIRGMVAELDQYSSYVPPKNRTRFERMLTQEFGGIGIQVNMRNGRLIVVSPVPGTPAYRAGMMPGDIITRIDDLEVKGISMNEAIQHMQGPVGQPVNLRIVRRGESQPMDLTVNRELISVSTVRGLDYNDDDTWNYWVSEDPKVAYVRLSSFTGRSAKDLEEVLRTLVSMEMEGLVLDLRFNPGGLLEAAIEMADLFLESGKIVSVKGRNVPERSWDARRKATLPQFPMAVLVNGYSASASEVLSACLQDNKRAVIVGERTWGKGSVQNVIRIEDGKSILKLTTAGYHRPSGVNIHRFKDMGPDDTWGVLPDEDFEIPYSRKQWEAWTKDRAARDVARRNQATIDITGTSTDSTSDQSVVVKDSAKQNTPSASNDINEKESQNAGTTASEDSTPVAEPPFEDTQLTAALNYILKALDNPGAESGQ